MSSNFVVDAANYPKTPRNRRRHAIRPLRVRKEGSVHPRGLWV